MGISSIYSKLKSEQSRLQSEREKNSHTLIMKPRVSAGKGKC